MTDRFISEGGGGNLFFFFSSVFTLISNTYPVPLLEIWAEVPQGHLPLLGYWRENNTRSIVVDLTVPA